MGLFFSEKLPWEEWHMIQQKLVILVDGCWQCGAWERMPAFSPAGFRVSLRSHSGTVASNCCACCELAPLPTSGQRGCARLPLTSRCLPVFLVARSSLLLFLPSSLPYLGLAAAAAAHLKHAWHVVSGTHPRSAHQSMLAGTLPNVCFGDSDWIWNARQNVCCVLVCTSTKEWLQLGRESTVTFWKVILERNHTKNVGQ